jgi:MiaB-like tRNA modifying enzyme
MYHYYIKTFGCKLNRSDSSLIEKYLDEAGFRKVEEISSADFVVVNTCAVVDTTSDKEFKELVTIKGQGKKLIIGGCLPAVDMEECGLLADGMISPTNINDIAKVVHNVMKGKKISVMADNKLDKAIAIDRAAGDGISCIIPISEGCLGSCTYCATRLARKALISFNEEAIVSQIKAQVLSGCREIQLTSQDLAVYGMEKGKQDLPSLLKSIARLDYDFKVKLGMMNPGWSVRIIEDLFEVLSDSHYYKFLHIPLQSGNDHLLSKMNRGYSANDYITITDKMRSSFKDGIIATDIIVGHPLETDEMFEDTMKVVAESRPDIIHIFKFSKRPGTIDSGLDDLPDRVKKERSRKLTRLFHAINEERNRTFVGEEKEVLVVEKRENSYLSRDISGRAVILKEGSFLIGSRIKVLIISSKWNYLEGRAI